MSEAPKVSVVIPTRNRPEYLAEALDSLRRSVMPDFEAWVMDQSDGDESERAVAALADDRIRYVKMPRLGACPARNFGAALAKADLVAFLDDDCSPQPDWLERIVQAFGADRDLQFIFGQLKAPPYDRAAGWFPEFLPSPALQRRTHDIVTSGAGANMSARKSFLRRIGGFDELLGPTKPAVKSNDASMNYKVLRSDARWIASSEIEVIHTNGFRAYGDLAELYRGYSHGLGVNYGRFLRRGDWRAALYFLRESWDLLRVPAGEVLHVRRPRGLRNWIAHTKGLLDGLRLDGRVGYIDGAEFRRMEATGRLDP